MDAARQQAITACGNCGQPEDAHKFRSGVEAGDLDLFAALGGPCTTFVVSDAALAYQKHLAIVDNRAPQRRPDGRPGRRNPICRRCTHRHQGECPL